MTRNHYYEAPHMTRTSNGNVGPCCSAPESEHPAFADGTQVRVQLTRPLRGLKGTTLPKGTILNARRQLAMYMQEVRPSRWGTNSLGQFAELERSEIRDVMLPGWVVVVDTYNTSLPSRYVKEV